MWTWRAALGVTLTAGALLAPAAHAADVVHPADPDGSTFTSGLDGWTATQSYCGKFDFPEVMCTISAAQADGELRVSYAGDDEGGGGVTARSQVFVASPNPGSAIFSMRQRIPLAELWDWTTKVELLDVAAATRTTILTDEDDRTDAAFGALVERAAPVTGLVAGRSYQLEITTSAYHGAIDPRPTTVAYDDVRLRVVDPAAAVAPALATQGATPGIDQAVARAFVNPRGVTTNLSFEYGTTTAYGAQTTPAAVAAGTAEATITGLQPCTTYHYRAVATSANGTSTGADQTFWTHCKPAIADTGAFSSGGALWYVFREPNAINPYDARLGGRVLTGGLPTDAYIEYGKTTAYGMSTAPLTIAAQPRRSRDGGGAGNGGKVPQLEFGTTYHMRVIAKNALGTTVGPDATFTTATPPPPETKTPAPAAVVKPDFLRIRSKQLKVARSGRRARQVRIQLTCRKQTGRACAGRIQVRSASRIKTSRGKRNVTFASFRYKLAAGKSGVVTGRISKANFALLRRLGKVQVTVDAQVTSAAGVSRIVSTRARLTTGR